MLLDRMTIKRFVCFLAVLSIAPLAAHREPKPVRKTPSASRFPAARKGMSSPPPGRPKCRRVLPSPGNPISRSERIKILMADIKGQEGSMLRSRGVVKEGQIIKDGVGVGGGVRIRPGRETLRRDGRLGFERHRGGYVDRRRRMAAHSGRVPIALEHASIRAADHPPGVARVVALGASN